MNCAEFQAQRDTWLDGELDAATSQSLEAHAAACADCAASVETARYELAAWRDAFQSPAAAARVAEHARQRILAAASPVATSSPRTMPRWLTPLLTFAAGFLVAIATVPRGRPTVPTERNSAVESAVKSSPPMVAHLVTATGMVERFDTDRSEWVAINPDEPFACPSDSRLRTQSDVRCELQTGNGTVIRLNDRTEVTLLGSSSVQLRQGQLWCRSPEDVTLEVRVATTGESGAGDTIARSLPTTSTTGPSCMIACVENAGLVRVINDRGEVQLQTSSGSDRLEPGQTIEIANGQLAKSGHRFDRLLATHWMGSLLAARGPDNIELRERVDALLAEIGRSKVSGLYEQEIRELGEYAVLPLVRYIQSPLSSDDPSRRQLAMRLSADLAPVWLIPELVELLSDGDAAVRRMAAATLLRLTGQVIGLAPDAWGEDPNAEQTQAIADWRAWWKEHGGHYPMPRVRILSEPAKLEKVM